VSFFAGVAVSRHLLAAALCILASCRSGGPEEETVTNVRPMTGGAGVAFGDCAEANRRALANLDLDVDSVPRPVSQRPRAFANMPGSVRTQINAKGSSVKVDFVVDTLGRADMKTFKVIESSHPWLAQNLRATIPGWTFRAARLAGCKVPRIYHFAATSRARKS
jgi:hypothetical protein